jgi:hypothetical protein
MARRCFIPSSHRALVHINSQTPYGFTHLGRKCSRRLSSLVWSVPRGGRAGGRLLRLQRITVSQSVSQSSNSVSRVEPAAPRRATCTLCRTPVSPLSRHRATSENAKQMYILATGPSDLASLIFAACGANPSPHRRSPPRRPRRRPRPLAARRAAERKARRRA